LGNKNSSDYILEAQKRDLGIMRRAMRTPRFIVLSIYQGDDQQSTPNAKVCLDMANDGPFRFFWRGDHTVIVEPRRPQRDAMVWESPIKVTETPERIIALCNDHLTGRMSRIGRDWRTEQRQIAEEEMFRQRARAEAEERVMTFVGGGGGSGGQALIVGSGVAIGGGGGGGG
jgi:hypothetical protein